MPINLLADEDKTSTPINLLSDDEDHVELTKPKKRLLDRAADATEKYINQPFGDASLGLAQGVANIAPGAANLAIHARNGLTGSDVEPYKGFSFAPDSTAAKVGEFSSYLLPVGGLAKGASRAVGLLEHPAIRKSLEAATEMASRSPRISGLVGTAGSGALQGAIYNPENQTTGAALGAGGNIIGNIANAGNPILKAIGRASFGGLSGGAIGYYNNGIEGAKKGAEYGAGIGLVAPTLLGKLGIGKGAAGRELLPYADEKAISAAEAGNRLNTPITIAEATGNPYVGKLEGGFGRVGESSAEKTKIGMERVAKQKTAIDDLLDTIYDKSSASKKKIADLYTAASKWNIKPEVVEEFKQDPVIAAAFDRVGSDVAYQRKLKGVAHNNVAYLNQVKRALGDMEGSALKSGEKTRAEEFKDARTQLVETIDQSVPAYKDARMEAQKSIIRSNIQKVLNNKEIKGTTFYKSVLQNDEKYNQLVSSLKNVPEAQAKLKDMKEAWKNLINIETPRSASGRAEGNTSAVRETIQHIFDLIEEATGSKRNKESLAYIHGGEWHKDAEEISKLKSRKERSNKYIQILSKFPAAIYTASSKDNS